jgi:hypothetical protein
MYAGNNFGAKWNHPTQTSIKTQRKPLRTLEELAEEFGVMTGQLMYAVKNAHIPAPCAKLTTGNKKWFEHRLMREWWAAVGGKDFAVSDRAEYNKTYRRKSSVT